MVSKYSYIHVYVIYFFYVDSDVDLHSQETSYKLYGQS